MTRIRDGLILPKQRGLSKRQRHGTQRACTFRVSEGSFPLMRARTGPLCRSPAHALYPRFERLAAIYAR